jgi:hypothetical protein
MSKLLLCILFVAGSISASTQKVYFIYIQSENEQPFFVKMNEKVHSSSATGYCILSMLRDSTYTFTVGFPQQKFPEQKFQVPIRSRDYGFLLKNFAEKGWGLFDLQTLAVQMPLVENKDASFRTEKKEVSAFTDILAKAADDPSLRENTVMIVKQPEIKTEEKPSTAINTQVQSPAIIEPAVVRTEEPVREVPKQQEPPKSVEVIEKTVGKIGENPDKPLTTPALKEEVAIKNQAEIKEQPAIQNTETPKSQVFTETKIVPVENLPEKKVAKDADTMVTAKVIKASEAHIADGVEVTYIDQQADGKKDTISILIPSPPAAVPVTMEPAKPERKFLDISTEPLQEAKKQEEFKKDVTSRVVPKNNCREVGTESDFLKLRKKMVAETDDDDMVDEARKYFRTKCFTTTQIRNLGVLFLDDLGKYKFFDMAYLFVSDIENFPSLQTELKNEYYINRFKAMLK